MKKFKVGDKVVCINNYDNYFLKLNNIYTIISNDNGIMVDTHDKIYCWPNRFILLKEYRKQKLDKIFENEKI
jgi:hypothetical protein